MDTLKYLLLSDCYNTPIFSISQAILIDSTSQSWNLRAEGVLILIIELKGKCDTNYPRTSTDLLCCPFTSFAKFSRPKNIEFLYKVQIHTLEK